MRPRPLARALAAGVLCAWLPACASPSHGAPVPADAGVVAVPSKLRACADLAACEEACSRGSAADCLSAGSSYNTGDGAPRDDARAASLFQSACALRSGPGCNLAGRMHEFGHGVPADLTRALSSYEDACGLGYAGGCYNVAVLLEHGRGAPRDLDRAASLYRRVCGEGSQTACAAASRLAPPR
jgi:TPR repeat protein